MLLGTTRPRQDLKGRKPLSTRTLSVAVVWFIFPVAVALGQQTPPASPIPAATQSQADCTGFITASNVPTDIIVLDGANNDLESSIRQFTPSESIYLYSRGNAEFSVGEQFSLVRPAKELFRTTRYTGEHWSIHTLGKPYEDVGRVQVTHVTPEGAVAEVSFTCGPIYPGDIAVPYQPRTIPDYVPAKLDRFALPNGKIQGTIAAARNNFASLADGDIVYLNFGEKNGARVGQRYRVYYSLPSPSTLGVVRLSPGTPRDRGRGCGPLHAGKVFGGDHRELHAGHQRRLRSGIRVSLCSLNSRSACRRGGMSPFGGFFQDLRRESLDFAPCCQASAGKPAFRQVSSRNCSRSQFHSTAT